MKFNFKSNSLSKGGYLLSLFQMLFFQSRKNHRRFIQKISQFFSISEEQVFLFGAGRMAVYSVLKSLKLNSKDEVIVAGYTCVVLTNAVKFADCKIKYVDINRKTLNIDQQLLFSAINENTKVLIIPHNFGLIAVSILEIKSKFPKVIIIEDGAHTFGSVSENRLCGTIGDAAFFSLEYSKPVTTGLGGILLVKNKNLVQSIKNEYAPLHKTPFKSAFKMIATLGVMNLCFSKRTSFFYTNGFRFLRLFKWVYQTSEDEVNGTLPKDYPVKLNPLLSNLGYNQLKKIEAINDKKRLIQNNLASVLFEFEDIEHYKINDTVLARFPILFKESISNDTIESIKKQALAQGFLFGEWFNDVVHPKGSFRYGYNTGMCPEGEFVASRILNIPINSNHSISSAEVQEIVTIFKENGIK
ncbi:MAG TPA: DegT/DnrJ/EryC1/StrS aminotransferase family protein [Crocinitomicaceae bacterium]|nr:DegT/DnrJ/EryC1/StrS aminotransferase family protein [Crocinitomicaceae bacterium]